MKQTKTDMLMIQGKPWYKSKTIWSALATAVITTMTAIYGDTNTYVAIVINIASALGIYGRFAATNKIN